MCGAYAEFGIGATMPHPGLCRVVSSGHRLIRLLTPFTLGIVLTARFCRIDETDVVDLSSPTEAETGRYEKGAAEGPGLL